MDIRIAVYCTGGTQLGFGHFFRSKTFAMSAPKGVSVCLFPVVLDLSERYVFDDVKEMTVISDNEEGAMGNISEFSPHIMVFDTVFCSDNFFLELRRTTKYLVSISPVFNQMNKVDVLFTRNENVESRNGLKIFSGFQYAIFNDNCEEIPDEIFSRNLAKQHLTIGIAMGGGDAPNKTLSVLKAVSQLKNPCTFWILLGEGYRHSYQPLVECVSQKKNHEIILAKTNRSAWSILSNCSVAILAGGLTTVEALYAGLPSINIFEKEEHMNTTSSQIFERNMAINLGLFKRLKDSELIGQISRLYEQRDQLLTMRNRSKGVFDKLGSSRIFDKLLELDNNM